MEPWMFTLHRACGTEWRAILPIKTNSYIRFLDFTMNEKFPHLEILVFCIKCKIKWRCKEPLNDVTHWTNTIISWCIIFAGKWNWSMLCCHRSWSVNGIFGKLNSPLESVQGCNLPRHGQAMGYWWWLGPSSSLSLDTASPEPRPGVPGTNCKGGGNCPENREPFLNSWMGLLS